MVSEILKKPNNSKTYFQSKEYTSELAIVASSKL